MSTIEKALAIALKAHTGQTDKAGRAYILHPLRLMSRMDNEPAMAAALLHDVIEDSDCTPDQLRAEGIPDEVVDAVLCLTKQEGEAYEDFIERASVNPIAKQVKCADLADNINIFRLDALSDKDLARLKKYHAAWQKLNR